MLEQIYGLYEINHEGLDIEIYVGAVDGSITIYINDEYFFNEKKFTLTHKCSGKFEEFNISILLKQRHYLSYIIDVYISVDNATPTHYIYDISEDPNLSHVTGRNRWIITGLLSCLSTMSFLYMYRLYGMKIAAIFGLAFIVIWWITEYIFLRDKN